LIAGASIIYGTYPDFLFEFLGIAKRGFLGSDNPPREQQDEEILACSYHRPSFQFRGLGGNHLNFFVKEPKRPLRL